MKFLRNSLFVILATPTFLVGALIGVLAYGLVGGFQSGIKLMEKL